MKRTEKVEAVRSFTERLGKAKAVILADYRGLKVSEMTDLRREVKQSQGEICVAKNRLVRRALEGTPWVALSEHLRGPTALAICASDPVPLTKTLAKSQEAFEAFRLRIGFVGGRLVTPKEIEAISKLPSKEELYAKLLGTIVAPASKIVYLLNAIPQSLARGIGEIERAKKAEGGGSNV